MKRERWTIRIIGGLLLAAGLGGTGCRNEVAMQPGDYRDSLAKVGSLGRFETDPGQPIAPSEVPRGVTPATVLNPELPARFLSLKEAIAIAMEQGRVGLSPLQPGIQNEILGTFTGRGTTGSDTLAAFAVNPAIANADIERSLSKFDARLISSITWNKNDQPALSLTQSFSNGDAATLSSTIAKPLPTGGVAGITFSTNYTKLSNPPTGSVAVAFNTSYTPRLQFVFEQPLLQGFGVEINQLLPNHPGSFLLNGFRTTGQGTEGILLTRLRAEQQRADFDRQVNLMLLNVEAAYWNLYAAYFSLAAQEEGLKQALEAVIYLRDRARVGIIRPQLALQNEIQYHTFRGQVLTARGQVLTAERALRNLLNLRSDAGDRLVPTDEPTLAPFNADYYALIQEARMYRPELTVLRQDVKARQLDLLAQRNLRRPDLRFISSYDIAGLGPRLDGANVEDNAFRSLASNQFNSYQFGLRFDMPIGFRDANAIVRQAQLNLKRAVIDMRAAEYTTDENIADRYRLIALAYGLIESSRAGRIASIQFITLELDIRSVGAVGASGSDATTFITNLLIAQQQLASLTAQEYQNVANYNIALARLEYEKGTIQRYNNVSVAEGPLPAHVGKRAADHFAAREAALKLREHPAELALPAAVNIDRPNMLSDSAIPQLPPKPAAAGTATPGTPALPTPPASQGTALPNPAPAPVPPAGPMTPTPANPAPANPAPANPRPVAPNALQPAPLPMTPAPSILPTGPTAALPAPQLSPGDPATFTPSGSVQLPARARPGDPAPLPNPVALPTQPVSVPR